jgi:hypothetical protein
VSTRVLSSLKREPQVVVEVLTVATRATPDDSMVTMVTDLLARELRVSAANPPGSANPGATPGPHGPRHRGHLATAWLRPPMSIPIVTTLTVPRCDHRGLNRSGRRHLMVRSPV